MKMAPFLLTLAAPLIWAALVVPASAAGGDIQKCLDWDGTIVYQDTPCAKGTGIGAIPRDTSRPSPEAIRQAEADRRLLGQILVAKAARSPSVQVIVPGSHQAPDEMADTGSDSAAPAPVYGYAPGYGYGPSAYAGSGPAVNHDRGDRSRRMPRNGESLRSPIARPPAILDSPAPCTTLSCARARGSAAGSRR